MTDDDLVFLDTETLGLHPDAPVWEFAAIRRPGGDPLRTEEAVEFTIHHDPTGWLDDFPEEFAADYRARYREPQAWGELAAAFKIAELTRGAHVVGAVPSFDTERLAKMLRRNGIEPEWHYHLIDVENVAVGWLHGVAARAVDEARARGEQPDPDLLNRHRGDAPPWNASSKHLSRAIGVDPDKFARHTAMGDVLWVRAQWDAITGVTQ